MKELLWSILLLPLICFAQNGPVVDTIYGRIIGLLDTTEAGATYEQYSGVPFATPPVGDLRFAKSAAPQPWEGTLDTTEFAKGCIEVNNSTETSEDCLYLNVYVPGQNRSGEGLAVMVFAHGGAFFFGRGSHYPGQDLAVHGDLIVVTVNYRLGALGFLSTEDEASPGNYGLWDVKLALEWVRDNIAAFGGSPDRVTMFGQSAGGAITSHMMISPETQGLLERGICISGSGSGYFGTAIPGAVASSSQVLARTLRCPDTNDSYALVDCLRNEDPNDINYWGSYSVILFKQQTPNFIPVIDGEFIPRHPAIMWNESAPSDLDLITGAAIHDGAYFILAQTQANPNVTFNLAGTKEMLDLFLTLVTDPYPGEFEDIREVMFTQYPGVEENDTVLRTQAVTELVTDWWFDTGAHYEASHHSLSYHRHEVYWLMKSEPSSWSRFLHCKQPTFSKKYFVPANTYLYQYAYPNSFLRESIDEEHQWKIADHSDDLYMIWGEEFSRDYVENVLNGEFSDEDKEMSSQMMSYYTNFANNGNPNEGIEVPVTWPQYSRETKEFLQFSEDTQVLVETEEDLDNYRFWTEEFPEVAYQ